MKRKLISGMLVVAAAFSLTLWPHAAMGPTDNGKVRLSGEPYKYKRMDIADDGKNEKACLFAVQGQALNSLKDGRGWVRVLLGKQ